MKIPMTSSPTNLSNGAVMGDEDARGDV